MSLDAFPDPDSEFGQRVRERLRVEKLIWFTSVGGDGTPQPNPVWFLWDGDNVVVYNRPRANRLIHIRTRPQVSLHFDSNGQGGDIVVLNGPARLLTDFPAPHQLPRYLDKYRDSMVQVSGSPESFSEAYPVAIQIAVARSRGF